jgi:hypothetical protein
MKMSLPHFDPATFDQPTGIPSFVVSRDNRRL